MRVFSAYGDISGNTSRLAHFTSLINQTFNDYVTLVFGCDGRWQFEDTNQTDLPVGTTDIVSGQRDYSFDVSFIEIEAVFVTDSNGNKVQLIPLDIHDQSVIAQAYLVNDSNNVGIPTHYDKLGGSVILQPVPNFNASAALEVRFKRPPSYFVPSDTDKVPGIPQTFHEYLSVGASLKYAKIKTIKNVNGLLDDEKRIKDSIVAHYSRRSKDERSSITSASLNISPL